MMSSAGSIAGHMVSMAVVRSSLTHLMMADKWRDPNIKKPQYTEHVHGRSHFPGPEKYKKRH